MSAPEDTDRDSRFARVDGLLVHYKRAGTGPALLLLHGSMSSLHGFERVAALLSSSFDVRAGALGTPILLVWGAGDLVTPIEGLEVARTLLMPQECRGIDSVHMVPFERPGDVADEIAAFVAMRSEGAVA